VRKILGEVQKKIKEKGKMQPGSGSSLKMKAYSKAKKRGVALKNRRVRSTR